MIVHKPIVALVVVLSLMLTGIATAEEMAKKPPAPAATAAPGTGAPVSAEYKIGIDDVLDIAVWNNTTMSRTVPVRPDGKISLPLLNEVQAAGLTPSQLRANLMAKITEYMPNPEVSVIVREVHSFRVSVIGEIRTPGNYELRSRTTVLDVLARAGPFNDFASRGKIVILRVNGSAMKRIPFNYNKVVASDGESENLFLQPGDIVVVP